MSKPKKLHKDIGSRVSFIKGGETCYGKLLAVGCDGTGAPNLMQREDDYGWELCSLHDSLRHTKARSQGVKNGTPNCRWIGKYKLTGKHTHRFNMCICGKKDA